MRHLKITFILFALTFLLASCGADKLSQNKTTKTTNALGSSECSCNTGDTIPVCGYNGNSSVTYLNACVAQCHGVSQYVQGNCSCLQSGIVCGDDGVEYTSECEAQAAIRNGNMKKIVKYSSCR
jgi:hypothetical protein